MNIKSKISVVMSVKDAQETISDSINSILVQSHDNFELLIMNDASTDNTAEIISQFEAKDPRVKIFNNKKNLGLTASLNILIKKSSGEFIARQDSDDVSPWAQDGVLKALSAGMVFGTPLAQGQFQLDPKKPVSRSFAAASLFQALAFQKQTRGQTFSSDKLFQP